MKIHIIATPRSGATAYALRLSKELNLPFINEPFKFANYYKKSKIGEFEYGGGIPKDVDSYVSHHIASQYLMHYDPSNIPQDHTLIFIDRRDKWKQMLSYFAMIGLYKKYNGFHNLNYGSETITVKERFVQRLIHEWVVFDIFTSKFPENKILYYEDLEFDTDFEVKKNQGIDNVIFKNKERLYSCYKMYYKHRTEDSSNLQNLPK